MNQFFTWSNFGFLHVLKRFRPILYMFIYPFHEVLQALFIYHMIYSYLHQRTKELHLCNQSSYHTSFLMK